MSKKGSKPKKSITFADTKTVIENEKMQILERSGQA